ncbi:MAG: methyl-accepting chemotaxis protein [Spirochaetales bacterium]|nr:methyl-accepting chemotaxis protein [Spirochaetales bacterium]
MNFTKKLLKEFNKCPFDSQVMITMFPLTMLTNSIIVTYCTSVTKLPMNYTWIQLTWISFITFLGTGMTEILFHFLVTKPLSNSFTFWESTELTAKERTDILEATGSFPIKKAFELGFMFIMTGGIYALCSHYILKVDSHVSIFYFHLYISLAYIFTLISIYILEKKCSNYAIKIAAQGIELKEKKFFGLSQRANFIIYLVFPIIGTSLVSLHAVFFTFHPQTINFSQDPGNQSALAQIEQIGLYIKMNFTKPEIMWFILKISIANTISTCVLALFYYVRILNSAKLMQNSLVMLNNKNIDNNNLFEVNIFSEDSYTMHLINRTIILFDSIIRNNTKTNKDIDEISRMLSEISAQTTENVIRQSSNIEEILATMQSVDNLSNKIDTNFNEVITVASKTMGSVDTTFVDLNENFDKIKEITDTNRITIDNLKKLSEKIHSIRDVINSIDKFAEQTKTVAFNAELEANNINADGVDFTNVAEEIRHLSNNILELTKKIHGHITDIAFASEEIIATGNYCMKKTKEGNEICIQLGDKFEDIKQSAKTTSVGSTNIKESLHEQTKAFHQIVETLSQIAKSVRNFGNSSTSIAETIDKLRQSSSHILALNNKYNKKENVQEGNAL